MRKTLFHSIAAALVATISSTVTAIDMVNVQPIVTAGKDIHALS